MKTSGLPRRDKRFESAHEPMNRIEERRTPRTARRAAQVDIDRSSRGWWPQHGEARLDLFHSNTHGNHAADDCTVILPGFPVSSRMHLAALTDLKAFLREHRLRRINSGFRAEGYAIRFKDRTTACAFRLIWPEKTMLPGDE